MLAKSLLLVSVPSLPHCPLPEDGASLSACLAGTARAHPSPAYRDADVAVCKRPGCT